MAASSPNVAARPEPDRVAGLVERVTFHSTDRPFCVLRLKVKGERELITLVGHTPTVAPGEYASASGTWVTDREHGKQFKAVFVKTSPPNTLTGIERYLGSGMVKRGLVRCTRDASSKPLAPLCSILSSRRLSGSAKSKGLG